MSETPRFSVIIPTYNRQALLSRTLASVFAQSHRGFEVTVVDDGSLDGTVEYLRSLGSQVRVVQQRHAGPGAARNAGAAVSTGDYLAFLDSDDLWLPWSLAAFAAAIERYDRPAYLCGRFQQFIDEQELADCREQPLAAEALADYLATWPRSFIVGASMIAVRRDEFARVGGFTPSQVNLEDHDLSLKLGTARGFVQLVQPVTLAWRLHPGGVTEDMQKSLAGCTLLMTSEADGKYPGGQMRARARRGIIASHVRSVSFECLKRGRAGAAWKLYGALLPWHLSLRRWKYLVGFPFHALRSSVWRG